MVVTVKPHELRNVLDHCIIALKVQTQFASNTCILYDIQGVLNKWTLFILATLWHKYKYLRHGAQDT